MDPTGNITFTHEEENHGRIPFLDTTIVRKADGSVKLLVYRKKTHRRVFELQLPASTTSETRGSQNANGQERQYCDRREG